MIQFTLVDLNKDSLRELWIKSCFIQLIFVIDLKCIRF